MAVAPDGSVYVGSNRSGPNGGPGMVTVIPPGSAKAGKRIRLNGAPREIVFAP